VFTECPYLMIASKWYGLYTLMVRQPPRSTVSTLMCSSSVALLIRLIASNVCESVLDLASTVRIALCLNRSQYSATSSVFARPYDTSSLMRAVSVLPQTMRGFGNEVKQLEVSFKSSLIVREGSANGFWREWNS
jgi:hypothetical protein